MRETMEFTTLKSNDRTRADRKRRRWRTNRQLVTFLSRRVLLFIFYSISLIEIINLPFHIDAKGETHSVCAIAVIANKGDYFPILCKFNSLILSCSSQVRDGIRVRGQDSDHRVRQGQLHQLDPRQLRSFLHHHLQRPRQRQVERQLHVLQESASPAVQVSTTNYNIL